MAEIGYSVRRAWALATLAGCVAASVVVLQRSGPDTQAVLAGSASAASDVVSTTIAAVSSSILAPTTVLVAVSPPSTSTVASTTTIMATTTAAPATIVATARAARAEEIEPEALEVAVAAAGRRPNSVSEMLEVHGEELSDAIEESVETFKAPPPDGGGVPLPPAPAGFICAVRATRPSDGLDPFYTKVCMASGIPVVSSAAVNDSALVAAAGIVVHMLNPRPDLRQKLIDNRLRVGVIGIRENALMMPEYRDLKSVFPDDDWTSRAYSATMRRPLVAVPEENLLCLSNDSYPGQSVLTHELGHSVVDLAVRPLDGSFWGRVENAYAKAMQAGRFRNSYAATNAAEYWAEGVQDFFDASSVYVGANGAGNGYDSPIGNRGDLASYDPVLYGLIRDVFTENPWRPRCPT